MPAILSGGGILETIEKIAAAFGAVVFTVGTLTGLALWLFKTFSEKWLNAKFAERLEAFKHDQQKEIEHLRFEINKLFDRTTKLHQREFEVLPKGWSLLVTSFHATMSMTAALQQYPDISQMTPAHLEEFLSKCPLEGWQRDELRNAAEKNSYYQQAIFWHRLNSVRKDFRKSALFLRRKGIFMPRALKEKFTRVEDLIWNALSEYELNKNEAVWPKHHTDQDKLRKEGELLMKELEAEVQGRLWTSDQLT
jgi:hypothetical protein